MQKTTKILAASLAVIYLLSAFGAQLNSFLHTSIHTFSLIAELQNNSSEVSGHYALPSSKAKSKLPQNQTEFAASDNVAGHKFVNAVKSFFDFSDNNKDSNEDVPSFSIEKHFPMQTAFNFTAFISSSNYKIAIPSNKVLAGRKFNFTPPPQV